MKKSSKNKNNFLKWILTDKLVFLILSVILLSLIILFFNKKSDNSLDINKNQPTPTGKILNFKKTETEQINTQNDQSFNFPSSTNAQIVNLLKKAYSILSENRDPNINGYLTVTTTGRVLWTDKDGYTITDENSPSVKWIYNGDYQKYQNNIHQYKLKIIPLIEKVFSDNGFKKQISLSGDYAKQISNTDYGSYIYVYEKDQIRCNFVLGEDMSSAVDAYINCSDQYQKNYQSQIKILTDLNIKGEILSLDNSIISGRHAFFMFGRTTRLAMMDANDKWHVLYKGLDPPSCDLVTKNKVPKSIIDTCYPSGNHVGTIPNPVN